MGNMAIESESQAAHRNFRRNPFWAFIYNVPGLPPAACGVLSPVIAGAAMVPASSSVVTGFLLLRRIPFDKAGDGA